jgi:guanyl-specific ribonuclease Sa
MRIPSAWHDITRVDPIVARGSRVVSKLDRFDRSTCKSQLQPWRPTIATAIVLLIVFYSIWQSQQPSRLPSPPVGSQPLPAELPAERSPSSDVTAVPAVGTIISAQTIRNEDGRVVYRGDIDAGPTLQRIESRERLNFPHDGSVFQNRERRLHRQAAGYYKEYVHPTPGLRGPGPQRIVVGARGEIYYTPDHYRTFQRLNE